MRSSGASVTTLIQSASNRVMAGVGFLNANYPDWQTLIQTETLNIACPQGCVIGQIFGDFNAAESQIFINGADPVALGFMARKGAQDITDFADLTREWRLYFYRTAQKAPSRNDQGLIFGFGVAMAA